MVLDPERLRVITRRAVLSYTRSKDSQTTQSGVDLSVKPLTLGIPTASFGRFSHEAMMESVGDD